MLDCLSVFTPRRRSVVEGHTLWSGHDLLHQMREVREVCGVENHFNALEELFVAYVPFHEVILGVLMVYMPLRNLQCNELSDEILLAREQTSSLESAIIVLVVSSDYSSCSNSGLVARACSDFHLFVKPKDQDDIPNCEQVD